ncbi:DUF3850 domain-containing protein [Neptunomonas japonica]|uniref:DUF3850 domain-containing protein n=1 Tax=Neptunomonas japonica JAMM 1380 TaxID=1441457 RepID=A0A7R6P8T7_9GAMM|nr:DUF3850 domain-containing protein [Neptunomonas japonica]BBB29344.1 conserved hypothetical protein [Neptunomonas japonica JAMM 1380]
MKKHHLKTDPQVFQQSLAGLKPFEIRLNDRDFAVGDILVLQETTTTGFRIQEGAPLEYTGSELVTEITSIVSGYGLSDGWVVMGVKPA